MAFKLKMDQRHDYQATAGVPVVVGIQPATTALGAAYYNGANLPVSAAGTVTFTPIVGTYLLSLKANPPFPPESWEAIELDGAASQVLESEDSTKQLAILAIVGN